MEIALIKYYIKGEIKMEKFIINDIADVVLKDNITGDVVYEGQAQVNNYNTDTHEVVNFQINNKTVTLGIDKNDIDNNDKLRELINKEDNRVPESMSDFIKKIESQFPIDSIPIDTKKDVSKETKFKQKAHIVIIPTVYDGVYVINKYRKGKKGRELSLLEALSILEKENKVALYLENGKLLRNF